MPWCKLSPAWQWLGQHLLYSLLCICFPVCPLEHITFARAHSQHSCQAGNIPVFLLLISLCPLASTGLANQLSTTSFLHTSVCLPAFTCIYLTYSLFCWPSILTVLMVMCAWDGFYPISPPIFLTSTIPLHVSLSSCSKIELCPLHSCHTWVLSNKIRGCIFQLYK